MTPSIPTVVSLLLVGLAAAQSPGQEKDVHPKLTTYKCTKSGGCTAQSTSLVFDSFSHWIHQKNNTNLNCGNWGAAPNRTICPNAATCQQNCVIEGITDYSVWGVKTAADSMEMHLLREDGNTNAIRLYLLNAAGTEYEMLKLAGSEFSFDVDVSKMPCGMNGGLYFSEMAANGGKSDLNTAGAPYGTGYCDAACGVTPFVNGVGNINAQGACCTQVDVWKANSASNLMASYACNTTGPYLCSGDACGVNGVCDKAGCGMNPYILGDKGFYGRGSRFQVDTSRPFTVVTQFPLVSGALREIHRFYVQDGNVVQNFAVNATGIPELDFMNDELCGKTGATRYQAMGGNQRVGTALSRGMAMVFGIWWDEAGFMKWLDSGTAGPCSATEGDPKNIRKVQPDPSVKFSKIRWGEIDSTYDA